MRSDWYAKDLFLHLLAGLMPCNRLAVEVSLRYGLRIGDVLSLRTCDVRKGKFSIREEKTGKRRTLNIGADFQRQLLEISGRLYIFEHRLDWRKHRSRQAVHKDIKRIAAAYRVRANISPHTARKIFAVDEYHKGGLKRVQRLLNHSDEAVTLIYALADEISRG